jgi:hypothetical protein
MGASTVAREAVETIVEGVGDDIVSQGAGIATRIQAGDVDVRGSLAISSLFGGARFMGARRAARYALEAERGVPGKLHSTPGAIKTAGDMYEYEPKRQLFGQTTPDTCAVACARMRLHDLGRISPDLGEDAVRRMLWMSKTDGNPIANLPGKLRAVFGVKSKFEWLSLKELDEATRHEPAIVSVKITGTAHAIIVDRVQRGFVMVRDPTQNPAIFGPNWEKNPGAAYRVPIEDFRMVYERAGGLGKAVTFRRADE